MTVYLYNLYNFHITPEIKKTRLFIYIKIMLYKRINFYIKVKENTSIKNIYITNKGIKE